MPDTCRHCQLPGHPSAKCPGIPTRPADREQPTDRLAILDGRDALAFVVIRPADEDPERIAVEASARGISKAVTAYALRQTADQFDRDALAEGDTPITADEAAAEQQQRAEQAAAEFDAGTAVLAGEQVTAYAAAIEAATLRDAADRITALGKARGWSTWAADYIHPEREFVDPGEDDEERPAIEEQRPADWVADVRAAIAFNLPEREPALETLRDVLLDTAPRSAEQALAAARLILAAHTRDQAAAVRKHIDAYRDEHGVNRSTRGLITGMGSIRRLLDQRADALDAEAQP